MLNRSHTAVIERNTVIGDDYVTEPYELAWAGQARWFIHVLDAPVPTRMQLHTEISPEGLTWCGHESSREAFDATGLFTLRIDCPGPYVRLRVTFAAPQDTAKVIIYLSMRQ